MNTHKGRIKKKSVFPRGAQEHAKAIERGTPTAGTADAGQEKSLSNTEQVAGKESQEIQSDNTSYQSCPTQEMLALMAATVRRDNHVEPALAVDYAFRLWESAGEKLIEKQQAASWLQSCLELEQEDYEGIQHPSKWPARFAHFLKLVVRAKTPADDTKRFRDFLRSRLAPEESCGRMKQLREKGFNLKKA